MKKIISLLYILFFSCSISEQSSFESLYSSFSNWYIKYSDDYSSTLKNNYSNIEKEFIGDFLYTDMKKFLIELNQINKRKISNKIDYRLLHQYLSLNIFKHEKIKYNEWNLIGLLDDTHSLLLDLLE